MSEETQVSIKGKWTDKLNISICHEGIRILVGNQKEENGQLKLLEIHYWNLFWDVYAKKSANSKFHLKEKHSNLWWINIGKKPSVTLGKEKNIEKSYVNNTSKW